MLASIGENLEMAKWYGVALVRQRSGDVITLACVRTSLEAARVFASKKKNTNIWGPSKTDFFADLSDRLILKSAQINCRPKNRLQ